MREIHGSLWDYWQKGSIVVVTTNCMTDLKGNAIMGAGVALQAAERFPDLPKIYGRHLREGYKVMSVPQYRLFLLPTKDDWKQSSKLELIEEGLHALVLWAEAFTPQPYVVLPKIGCGLGLLDWETQVKPIMDRILVGNNYAVIL